MGTDLAVRETNVLTAQQLRYIAHTEFVPSALRGKEPAILACVATGRALGIDDMTSLRSIHIIDGKATFSAELMVQLVRRRGHSITGNFSAESCTVTGKRADNGDEMTVTWTKEMAEAAGLLGKSNWKKYGASMLWARAVSQLSRMLFADCFAGATYTPDEVADGDFAEIGGESEGDGAAYGTHPGSVEPDSASGTEPLPADEPSPDAASAAQIKKLNVLVGTLRDAGHITTTDVWTAVGRDPWMEGHGEDPHWSPLRDSLTRQEASDLIELLSKVEADVCGLSAAQFRANVKDHGVSAEAGAAAMHKLFPGVEKSSDLTDQQRAQVWKELQA